MRSAEKGGHGMRCGFAISLRVALLGGVAAGFAACAPAPETIPPTAVSPLKYQAMSCQNLLVQVAEMDQRLAALYTQQRSNQANDTFKGIFFLQPRATIVGPDLVPTISLVKGERYAANAALQARCPA